jgi:hypothetical protein
MNRTRLATLLPALALGAGLAACAPYPADPYYGSYATPTQSYVAAPGYGASYATPMPAYVGQGEYRQVPAAQAYAGGPYAGAPYAATPYAAAAVDPYCREAYAAAAGAQQQAAISGSYADAARADRSAGFYRRDC